MELKELALDANKISDILKYTESDLYDDKEKAVLDLAFAAGKTPNECSQKSL